MDNDLKEGVTAGGGKPELGCPGLLNNFHYLVEEPALDRKCTTCIVLA